MVINRRGFLQTGAAALTAGVMPPTASALQAAQRASAVAPANSAIRAKLTVDAYSRHLQWLRSAQEVSEAAIEMGFGGVDITVRPYPGHVLPEKVETDLAPFVNTVRKNGLKVSMITCPITDAESPNAEKMLATAASLGIHHYWWGTFRLDPNQPVMAQLDGLKPRVEKLARLNEKYKMKAMYHTYSNVNTVGANVWDFLYVLRDFDPQYVSFHWDAGHTSVTGGNGTWAQSLRAAGPYIGGVAVKEYTWSYELDNPGGGAFTGTPASLNQRGPGGPGGPPGAGGPPAAGGAPVTGVRRAPEATTGLPPSQAAEQAAAERGAAAEAPRAPGIPAGANPGQTDRPPLAGPGGLPAGTPGGQNGAPAGFAGSGGPGRGTPPGRGGGGEPNPWREKSVPLGAGINNLPLLGAILKEINFNGPIEIQAEYPNGGAENAGEKITLPRALVLGNMKRDLLTLKAAFLPTDLL